MVGCMYERPKDFDLDFDAANLVVKEIERDEGQIEKILDAIETFWIRCMYLADKPDMKETEFYTIGNDVDKIVARVEKFELQMMEFEEKTKLLKQQQKAFREELYKKMEENDIKKIDTGDIVITRVLPTQRKSVDSTRLKKEQPSIYEEFLKVSNVKGSIRIAESKGEKNNDQTIKNNN